MITVREFAQVLCTAFEGEDDETWARVSHGQVFCSQCGATDHEVIS